VGVCECSQQLPFNKDLLKDYLVPVKIKATKSYIH
jgi:hypothetical protein